MKQKIEILLLFLISLFFIISPSNSHEINQEKIEIIIKKFLTQNPNFIQSILDDHKKTVQNKKKQNAITLLDSVNNPGIFVKNANVTIYEFFDYNCGYCKSVVKTILDVISEDNKINIVFVEFPILSKESYTAAAAALASEKQGLYTDFHLSLMKIRGRINEDIIFKTAKNTGLDINKLKTDMKSLEIEYKLKQNREIAKLLGLNGTPAFIIGNIIYPGALEKNSLKRMIKQFREN